MPEQRFEQGSHGSTPVENNYMAGFDAFNSLSNTGVPAFTQPNFGQSWSGAAGWNSTPTVNFDISSPFQSGFAHNDWSYSNQQNDRLDYSEDDDYYDDNEHHSANASNLTADSNERSKMSLASQAKQLPGPTENMMAAQASGSTMLGLSQPNFASPSRPQSTDLTSSSKQVTSDRANELRAKLLASKRARSTTPLPPPTPSRPSGTPDIGSINKTTEPGIIESPARDVNNSEVRVKASTNGTATAPPKDKSLQHFPKASKLPPANTDIQGLIDEYRAAELVKGPQTPLKATTQKIPPLPSTISEQTRLASKSNDVGAEPQPIVTNGPSKSHNASRRSSESGEILSDQESGPTATRNDQAPSAADDLAKSESRDGPLTTVAASSSGQTRGSQLRIGLKNASKPQPMPSTSRHDLRPQDQDQRQSIQPAPESRNVPLAQRIDHSRKVKDQPPPLQALSGTNTQRGSIGNKNDKRLPPKPSVFSTPARPGRPQPSSKPDNQVARREVGDDAKNNDEPTAMFQQQATEKHESSSQPQIVSAARGSSSRTLDKVHGSVKSDSSSAPIEPNSQMPHPHTSVAVPSAVSRDQISNILSLSQQEQIQSLGLDLSSEGLRDLHDFLEYHRFFVKEYRDGFLARQRRLRALEEEKIALERESLMQYELFYSMRAQSLAAREHTEPLELQGKPELLETSAIKPMAPPLHLQRNGNKEMVTAVSETNVATPTRSLASRTNEPFVSRVELDRANLKRQLTDNDVDLERGRKVTRFDSDVPNRTGSQPVSPRTARAEPQALDKRRSLDYRAADNGYRGRSPSPYRRASYQPYQSRQDSWTAPSDRGQDRPRLSNDELRRDPRETRCRRCDRVGHFTVDCPDERRNSASHHLVSQRDPDDGWSKDWPTYPSRGNRGYPATNYRGASRGGRAGYQFRRSSTPYRGSPARQGAVVRKGSESLNLKAGGQSRSTSFSADLP